MKIKARSLKFSLIFWFMFFVGVMLVLIWAFQSLFIKSFYRSRMWNEIEKTGKSLVSEYNRDKKDNFPIMQARETMDNNFLMIIKNNSGTLSIIRGGNIEGLDNDLFLDTVAKRIEINDDVFSYKQDDMEELLFYIGCLKESQDEYLVVGSVVAPTPSTMMIVKDQLIVLTIISLMLGALFAYIITMKLAQPITRIEQQAGQLAKGNYDVYFDCDGYLEVNKLSDTLNITARELKKNDDLRRSIVANVSHDLRTPLTIIKSYAEMIRDLSGDDKVKREKNLKIIIDETDRLSLLVNDYLELSKLESGSVSFNVTEFSLSDLLERCLASFDIYQMKDGYHFNITIDEVNVKADIRLMGMVLYNLIGNAINYTGDDKTIDVSLTVHDRIARFEVMNSGKEIDVAEKEAIWEQYYRNEKNHQRVTIGTGLGLSIVKNIFLVHNLPYGVESADGKTKFYFEIDAV